MNQNFYIQLTYRSKAQDEDVSRPIKAGMYVDNFAWDEIKRKLWIGNQFFEDVVEVKILSHVGETMAEFSNKLGIKLLA